MTSTFNGVDTDFVDKIHATVLQTLRPVDGEGEISRDRRLHALFNDLTCRIDPEVRHHFRNEVPVAQRYYLLLSHYYLAFPEKAEEVLDSSLHLWSSLHMPLIFALLFHEYLFIQGANNPENSIKRMASFVKGANKLFWLDLENSSKRFAYIWMFLLKGVLESPQRWQCLLARRYCDVFDLVSKFYFYYMGDKGLETFIKSMTEQFPKSPLDTPASHQKLKPINMFCNEVVRTMKLIKSEEVLKHYLYSCRCFAKSELNVNGKKTLLRLGDLISDLATPGYPMYPTSEIKEEAKRTLNIIWPYGAFLREVIRFSFRLLRPLSFLHWFQYRGAQAQSLLANIWLWITGTLVLILSAVPLLSRAFPGNAKQVRQDAIDAANRSKQLVSRLSLSTIDSPRRVRFALPDDEEDSEKVIPPPTNRAQSPLRSSSARKRGSIAVSPMAPLSNSEAVPFSAQPEETTLLPPSLDADVPIEDEEGEEDKDDNVDIADLEHYIQYTAHMAQAGVEPRLIPNAT
jgi:hypothetical protein